MITNIETLNEEKPEKVDVDEVNAVTTMASDIYEKDNTADTRSIVRLSSMPELASMMYPSHLPINIRGSIQQTPKVGIQTTVVSPSGRASAQDIFQRV